MKFDKAFIEEIVGVPIKNKNQLAVVEAALQKAIEEDLTPRQREVLHNTFCMKQEDVADKFGVNVSTVSKTLKRAKVRLRKCLAFYSKYLNCNFEDE